MLFFYDSDDDFETHPLLLFEFAQIPEGHLYKRHRAMVAWIIKKGLNYGKTKESGNSVPQLQEPDQ